MKRQIWFLALSMSLVMTVFVYQNCSQISLVPHKTEFSVTAKADAEICPTLSDRGLDEQFEIAQLFILNLTAIPTRGELLPDSDIDGVPDQEEAGTGLSPTNPRTHGVLDSVCRRTGSCTPDPTCTGKKLFPGLTDCDLMAAGAPKSGGWTGLDTDQDSIPDFIELIRGTDPLQPDADISSADDGIPNIAKILNWSDPLSNTPSRSVDVIQYKPEDTSTVCHGSSFLRKVSIQQLPLVHTLEYHGDPVFQSATGQIIDFSHKADENVIGFIVVSAPSIGSGGREYYFASIKVSYGAPYLNFSLKQNDFIFIGADP